MVLVGQPDISKKIEDITFENCPQVILLEGTKGSGRHTISNMIAEKLNLPISSIDNNLNKPFIDSVYLSPDLKLFTIDSSSITKKEEGVLLKFLEEPPATVKLIIFCENCHLLLPTVYNRCTVWKIKPYDIATLTQFTIDELCLKIARNPGECLLLQNTDMVGMYNFCNLIFDKISVANFSNILTIPQRIAFNDKEEGFPLEAFLRVLIYSAMEHYTHGTCKKEVFDETSNLLKDMTILNINKKHLFENFLCALKLLN